MGATDAVLEQLLRNSAQFSDAQVAETVDLLLARGVEHGASDIHMQPQSSLVAVRYRIDGALHGMHKLPLAALPGIVEHLKHLAELGGNERVPQEGRFEITVDGRTIGVRLSIMPVIGGQHVVLHLATAEDHVPSLEEIGLWGHGLAAVRSALARTRGLVLVAGAQQVATNRVLASLVGVLNRPTVSTITIEQHVGYTIHGAVQTELRGPSTIALQAALRHDPNIVMIDSLPDAATALAAAQAASASHLVLAGVHAGNTFKALLHLEAAGVERFLLSSALQLVIAEHQVPKLCAECRVHHQLSDEERLKLEKVFGISTASARARVHELERQAAAADLGIGLPLSSSPHGITHVWRENPNGCPSCHHRSTKGQVTLTEVVVPTDHFRQTLAKATTETALQAAAVNDGAVPLALDGLIKALRGLTTIEAIAPIV